MRRGELLALRWDDVDFEKGMVYVRRTMSWITGFGYKESEPKTKAGRRKIVLAKFALEALKEHRVHQSEARSKAGDKWCENGIIFCSIYGGFFNPAKVLEIFKQLLKDAGLPHMRFHDVRRFGDCKIALKGQKVRAITF